MNKRPKGPRYGDPVFVPNLADGWIRGTVQCYGQDTNGRQVQPNDYLKEWAWPEDMPIILSATN